MICKKIALVVCLLCTFVVFSCGEMEDNVRYTFDNRSDFILQITLSKPYKNEASSEAYTSTGVLTLYPMTSYYYENKKTVYVDNTNVNFQWNTNSASDNAKVYCTVNGSTATFRNR